jgi:CBS domain-containing protein
LLWLGPINIVLALFNLLPGFPLDGGRALRALLWWSTGDMMKATRWATLAGRVVAWGLMGIGVLEILGGAVFPGLWLMLIGWFLNMAAINSYRGLLVSRALRDVSVARVMRTKLDRVPAQLSIEALVRDHLVASDQHGFPVEVDGELAGLVTRKDVGKLPHDVWPAQPVADIMTPLEQLTTLPPEASAERALAELSRLDVDQIPVMDRGHLLGMVLRRDLLKWVALRDQAFA